MVIIVLPVRAVPLKVQILITQDLKNPRQRGNGQLDILNVPLGAHNIDSVQNMRSQLMCLEELVEMINVLIVVLLSQIGHP